MRFALLISVIILSSLTFASDADVAYAQGLDSLTRSQSDHIALLPAIKLFAKAAELYEADKDDAKAAEVNSCLYWARKKLTLADTDGLKADTVATTRLDAVAKPVDASEAQRWLERAHVAAKAHQDQPLLIAIQYFEVGDRFKDTAPGRAAIDLSLKAMQQIGEKTVNAKPVEYKPATTDGKVFVQSEPPGASIYVLMGDSKRDTGKKTPSMVMLPKGSQNLVLELRGMKPTKETVVSGDVISKTDSIKLEPICSPVDIVFESGWSVFVGSKVATGSDGMKVLTPCTIQIPIGNHTVFVVKDGFYDISQRVTVKDTQLTLEIKNKPVPGPSAILQAIKRDAQMAMTDLELRLLGKWAKFDGHIIMKNDHSLTFTGDRSGGKWEVNDEKSFTVKWGWGAVSVFRIIDADNLEENRRMPWKRVK